MEILEILILGTALIFIFWLFFRRNDYFTCNICQKKYYKNQQVEKNACKKCSEKEES